MTTERPRWWLWVAGGVSWGLLCVGVRHVALATGIDMQRLLAERSEVLARVQALEREAAEAKRLDSVERLATAAGFAKPASGRIVIVPPEPETGLLARVFGTGRPASVEPAADDPQLAIRPREEVVAPHHPGRKPVKGRRAAGRRKKRDARADPAGRPRRGAD